MSTGKVILRDSWNRKLNLPLPFSYVTSKKSFAQQWKYNNYLH